MSTINQKLLGLLQEEIGTGKTQVYWHVARKREITNLPREQAAIALAMELGIDVSRFATEYDLKMIREVEPGLVAVIDRILPEKKNVADSIENTHQVLDGHDPFLDPKTLNNAHKNAEICAKLFLLENSIRRVVHAVMEKKHGVDWWYDAAPRDIMYATFDRRSGENETRWRGQFGAEPIYYTDIRDLSEIMKVHQDIFKGVYGKELMIDDWIDIVERVRSGLVHTNPVTLKERNKFLEIFEAWNGIARDIHNKLNNPN
jgi:hypothetical protein